MTAIKYKRVFSNKGGSGGGTAATTTFTPSGTISATDVQAAIQELDAETFKGYWTTVLGTPVRVGNTSFTVTDTANANLYDQLLSRTTVLKWTDTGITKIAMVASAVYAANNVTITLLGDTLTATATMSTMKYALLKADVIEFPIAGNLGVINDITKRVFMPCTIHIFGGTAYHGTAGTTNATTYTISKNVTDGTATVMTAAISIASGATVATADIAATSGTDLVQNDYLTVNCTAVSTTPPVDAYIYVFAFATRNVNLL